LGILNPVEIIAFIFHCSVGLNTQPILPVIALVFKLASVKGNLKNVVSKGAFIAT
jgi:hypothetical protein